jgi:hypothetical protein
VRRPTATSTGPLPCPRRIPPRARYRETFPNVGAEFGGPSCGVRAAGRHRTSNRARLWTAPTFGKVSGLMMADRSALHLGPCRARSARTRSPSCSTAGV